ncbi:MAG: hypothetical protein K9L70_02525 [Thiohalocapsa sp.]|jgi:hypothetical protein|nr:hypothetical protein [Thiohalocapsa sp.]MCF7990075.1 hypothetical protein [Thiohalocapsa sp.]
MSGIRSNTEAIAEKTETRGGRTSAAATVPAIKFTVSGAGVLHVRASDVLQSEAAQRQISALSRVKRLSQEK